jgi:hypothetical protein
VATKLRIEDTIETGDIIGIVNTEDTESRLPRVKKKTWSRKEIEERLGLQRNTVQGISTPFSNISMNKYDLGSCTKFNSSITSLSAVSSSNYQKCTTNSLSKPWMNG